MDLNQMTQGQPQRPAITESMIKDAKVFECTCGGKIFTEKMILKKISSLVSPTGREEVFPMNLLVCESCGKMPKSLDKNGVVPEEFLTKE